MPKLQFKNNSGFAVLFTVLISSIVLAIAIGISSISYQEVVLSSSAREGNISFYAADTGAECALYWDIKCDTLGTDICGTGFGTISCAGTTYSITAGTPLDINLSNNSCARIKISKNVPAAPYTTVESLGYNVACGQISAGSPRMVERAIRVVY